MAASGSSHTPVSGPGLNPNDQSITRQLIGAPESPIRGGLEYVGGWHCSAGKPGAGGGGAWFVRPARFGRPAFFSQIVRLGLRATRFVALTSACIGAILELQMAPTLDDFGQIEMVADIIAVAVVQELGPL